MQPTETLWKITCNLRAIAPRRALTLTPGRLNRLGIESLSEAPETVASLVRTLPDGRRIETTRSLVPGATQVFDLGPLTAPPIFTFEAGAVFQTGYRLVLTLRDAHTGCVLLRIDWAQGLSARTKSWRIYPQQCAAPIAAGALRFEPGGARRLRFNPKRAIEASLELRLEPSVLDDPDAVAACFRLMPGARVRTLTARLRVRDAHGTELWEQRVTVRRADTPGTVALPARDWPAGDYTIALHPLLDGQIWAEGPCLTYRRRAPEAGTVRISPLAPWALARDAQRETITIADFEEWVRNRALSLPEGWQLTLNGDTLALTTTQGGIPSADLGLPLQGVYALFAAGHAHGCLLQCPGDGLVRLLPGPDSSNQNNGALATAMNGERFVGLVDFANGPVRIHAFDAAETVREAGLRRLRLEPVTPASVEAFRSQTRRPPRPLSGVNDWGCYFSARPPYNPPRMRPDQFATIVGGQAELGISALDWSVGRSCVSYHSRLPDMPFVQRGPEGVDPLAEALRHARQQGVDLRGWYALMYYSDTKSKERGALFAKHPEWRRWRKHAEGPDPGIVGGQLLSFYFPEIREDKLRVLREVAERGADRLLVGTCRLAPVVDYHPELVAVYRRAFGVDPLAIREAHSAAYRHWIAWRADVFTELLRELRKALEPLEAAQQRRIPVGVRLSSAGLDYNLAQGLDPAQWLDETLVDYLQVTALEDRGGATCNAHDIRPYVELARRHGIPVFGGLGATWMRHPEALPACLRRARGLLAAGVDGIELYESELLAHVSAHRWTTPLFGNLEALEAFLAESNLDACYPIGARTCLYGYDNHSRWMTGGHPYVWQLGGLGEDCL